jgi:hypothetical protein
MHPLDEVERRQQIGFAGSGRRTPDIDAAHRAGFGEHHGAAGGAAGLGEVADADAGHIGDRAALRQQHASSAGGGFGRGDHVGSARAARAGRTRFRGRNQKRCRV